MTVPTTTSWICDTCGELIEQAEDGCVEWIGLPSPEGSPSKCRDIHIVHYDSSSPRRGGCQFNPDRESAKDEGGVAGFALPEYQGPDGLMRLLEMIAEPELPTPEVLEIIKRIHIPGYEHARRHFERSLAEEIITEDVAPGYWLQREIQQVLDTAAEEKW